MTPQKEPTEQDYEKLLAQSKRMKKKIGIAVLAILLALLLLLGVPALIASLKEPTVPAEEVEYEFYPTYTGDIMENQDYLDKNRDVRYCADSRGLGVTQPLDEELMKALDPTVRFVYDYLQTVISGEHDTYNTLFTDEYLDEYGEKNAFSPQMIYDATIYYDRTQTDNDGNKLMTYRLDYKIYRNDGTFRRDIGSDAIRSQYIVLKISKDGSIAIQELISFRVGEVINQEDEE